MIKRKREISFWGVVLVVIGLCMVLPGFLLTAQLPNQYQYVVPAGDLAEFRQDTAKALERLTNIIGCVLVSGRKQNISLPGIADEVNVTLYAIDANYTELHHETLITGRLISDGDVQKQRNIIVIDQNTAYALFTGGHAIGKTLSIGQTDWTIVGIVASKVRLGESAEGIAFVPITSAAVQQLSMDTMEVRMAAEGLGNAALINTTLEQWCPGGSFYALEREKYATLMPLYWAVVVISLLCTILVFRWFVASVRKQFQLYRKKLENCYTRQMLLWIMTVIIKLLLVAVAAVGSMLLTIKLITIPALIFTDWIPENPVSISSYASRFWAIHHDTSKAVQYITREKHIVSLASWMIRRGTMAIFGGMLITMNKGRNAK